MSWKGFKKAVVRFPENVKQKVGGNKDGKEDDFSIHEIRLKALNEDIGKLLGQIRQFRTAVTGLTNHQSQVAALFKEQHVANGEYDNCRPNLQYTKAIEKFHQLSSEAHKQVFDDLIDLDRRVTDPLSEVISLLKPVNKLVVKRSHKLLDVNRHTSSLDKMNQKTQRDVQDEKNLYKLELLVQQAKDDFNYIDNILKEDFPKLWEIKKELVTPLFTIFYQMQSKFYKNYFIYLNNLRELSVLQFDQPVIEGYKAKDSEISQVLNSLDALSASSKKRSSLSSRKKETPQSISQSRTTSIRSTTSSVSRQSIIETASTENRYSTPPPYTPSLQKNKDNPVSPLKRPPPPPLLIRARALYDFDSETPGDLPIRENEIIEIIKKSDSTNDWWTGRVNGQIGIFPANYVELI